MRVVIVVVSSAEHISGVPRHAANMALCLLDRKEITSVYLVAAQWQCAALLDALPCEDPRLNIHAVSPGRSTLMRNIWYYSELPKIAARLRADIVHLAYPVPVNRSAFLCPVVATLHDLYPYDCPQNFGFPKVLFNRLVLQQCLREVDAIACVSNSTLCRLDIHGQQIAMQKALTIYNCVEPGPSVPTYAPFPNLGREPFFLCVGQHRRNKNIHFALEVFRRMLEAQAIKPTTRFVIIGTEGPETRRIRRCVAKAGLSQLVVLLHGISEAELHWCYAHAEVLLAPSTVEGFGLPIVEAALHHCRIVCSDIPAFREVGGAACRYVPLDPPAEDAFVLATAAELKTIRFREISVERFSSARVAESYFRLYSELQLSHSKESAPSLRDLVPAFERKADHE